MRGRGSAQVMEVLLTLLLTLLPLMATAAQDPTRPPGSSSAGTGAASNPVTVAPRLPVLRYILYSAERRLVMLDDQLLAEGQNAYGVTVRRILPNAVIVIHNGREKTLQMFAPGNTAL